MSISKTAPNPTSNLKQLKPDAPKAAEPQSVLERTLSRVIRNVAEGNYKKALELVKGEEHYPQIRNAKGVCLLRMGRYEEAIRVFRELVMKTGCTWMLPDVPTLYKTNFATALLLGGRPSGCQQMLNEIGDEAFPSVQRLRKAIRTWESKLSWWQKLNWRFGSVAPVHCTVEIDFPAGEFGWEPSRDHTAVASLGGASAAV